MTSTGLLTPIKAGLYYLLVNEMFNKTADAVFISSKFGSLCLYTGI